MYWIEHILPLAKEIHSTHPVSLGKPSYGSRGNLLEYFFTRIGTIGILTIPATNFPK